MRKPHKHAELIKAWADGEDIEVYDLIQEDWVDCDYPKWHDDHEYRIKPEPKPDVVKYCSVIDGQQYLGGLTVAKYKNDNLKLTFDSETGALKAAEVLK